ncbi:MAG TPA: adenylyl-sulfate kinase [Methylomirabilota bacterium]|nr:adenylyl-sulfate kinase [Methylomirabilota bacterium]
MSWAIWITGLPGSGKSVLARAVVEALRARGESAVVLELDAIRKILTPAPTYSDAERDIVYRALAYMARLLTESGVPIIVDATGHRRAWRDLARALIPAFAEVQLTCPIEVCRQRERTRAAGNAPRGIYAAAGQPGATVPGVDVPYEPALDPEVTVDTLAEDVTAAVPRIVSMARDLARSSPPRLPSGLARGWAVWITGLPGSGKTTLASAVAEQLAARGIPVRLLELTEVREFLLPDAGGGPRGEDIVYHALVCAAKLLTDAGVAVIIDATAPRRAWRELARALIGHYAEVQLVCPPEICGDRERASRWQPAVCPHAGRRKTAVREAPDIVFGYEGSLNPELTIHTGVRSLWSATADILRLAHRLHRTAMISTPLT